MSAETAEATPKGRTFVKSGALLAGTSLWAPSSCRRSFEGMSDIYFSTRD